MINKLSSISFKGSKTQRAKNLNNTNTYTTSEKNSKALESLAFLSLLQVNNWKNGNKFSTEKLTPNIKEEASKIAQEIKDKVQNIEDLVEKETQNDIKEKKQQLQKKVNDILEKFENIEADNKGRKIIKEFDKEDPTKLIRKSSLDERNRLAIDDYKTNTQINAKDGKITSWTEGYRINPLSGNMEYFDREVWFDEEENLKRIRKGYSNNIRYYPIREDIWFENQKLSKYSEYLRPNYTNNDSLLLESKDLEINNQDNSVEYTEEYKKEEGYSHTDHYYRKAILKDNQIKEYTQGCLNIFSNTKENFDIKIEYDNNDEVKKVYSRRI